MNFFHIDFKIINKAVHLISILLISLQQMLDMVKPASGDKISLSDLKKCKQAKIFFDTFFNIEKYLEHEQKDPFAPQKVS